MNNKEQTAVLLPGGVTQETFNEWKAKNPVIHRLKVVVKKEIGDQKEDIAYGYIKDVNEDLDLMSNILSIQGGNRILEAKVFLLENAWLGGDSRIKSVTSIKIAAATQAAQTIDILDGGVEKL